METKICPVHGAAVRDLVRGALGDHEAAVAERAVADCEACRRWWAEEIEPHREAVAAGVDEALQRFEAPRRDHHRMWPAAVAAAAVLGVVGLLAPWGTETVVPDAPEARVVVYGQIGELSDVNGDGVADAADVLAAISPEEPGVRTPPQPADDGFQSMDFESGDLSGWSSNT